MSYLHSLAVFFAVVEEGGFSAAGRKMELSQPTVSFHIDNLEKRFGCPLFLRLGKKIELNAYGEELYQHAKQINGIIEHAHNKLQAMIQGASGHVLIGASTIPGEYILPRLIADFRLRHPAVTISLETQDSETILTKFSKGCFPIAIVGSMPQDGKSYLPIWHDEIVLVGYKEVVEQFRSVSLSNLRKIPLIMRRVPSGSRNSIIEALAKQGITSRELNIVFEAGGNEGVKTAVLNQAGLAFISKWAVKRELDYGLLQTVAVPELKIERNFYGLCDPVQLSACGQFFWDTILNAAIR